MKKVLLSLSMLAAIMVANAQNQFVIWNATNGTTQITGTPYNFGVPGTGNPPAVPADPVVGPTPVNAGLFVDTASFVISANGSCAATKYYVGGMGAASFSAPNVGLPWSTNVTGSGGSLANYYLNVEIKASGATAPKIKFQLSSKDSSNVQGYILDLTSATGVATSGGFKIYSIALGSFSNTIGLYGDPINTTGNFMTKHFADSLFKIEYSVNVGTTTDGSGSVAFQIKNQWLGTSKTGIVTSTNSAAANIGSSVVYPNPTSGTVNVNLTLQNPAKVTMIVTDMVGKQIATQNFGTVSSIQGAQVFDSAGLAKGMYTVTYVLDGTPAKTELVVVK
jgi:hypothetical protein